MHHGVWVLISPLKWIGANFEPHNSAPHGTIWEKFILEATLLRATYGPKMNHIPQNVLTVNTLYQNRGPSHSREELALSGVRLLLSVSKYLPIMNSITSRVWPQYRHHGVCVLIFPVKWIGENFEPQ